jgi:hypothetical protein
MVKNNLMGANVFLKMVLLLPITCMVILFPFQIVQEYDLLELNLLTLIRPVSSHPLDHKHYINLNIYLIYFLFV